jgi:hypothetical protein
MYLSLGILICRWSGKGLLDNTNSALKQIPCILWEVELNSMDHGAGALVCDGVSTGIQGCNTSRRIPMWTFGEGRSHCERSFMSRRTSSFGTAASRS